MIMKKLIAVLCCLSAIGFLHPAMTQAFTLYTPPSLAHDYIICTIANVGNIELEVDLVFYNGPDPYSNGWEYLPPGGRYGRSNVVGVSFYDRCAFNVRARNNGQQAKSHMVRAGAVFKDTINGGAWSFEAK
jgi:hypothetical protein